MASFAEIIKKREKDWECDSLMENAKSGASKKIPFSSPLMNWATYGGIPRARITELSGDYGAGKSTSAADLCMNAINIFHAEYDERMQYLRDRVAKGEKTASAQISDLEEAGPRRVLYIDLEHGFDWNWASKLGLQKENIDIMQPPDIPAEDLLQTLQELIESGEVGMVVLDSVPSLVTKSEIEKKFGERTVASLAGLMTIFMRKIVPILTRYDCTMVLINQIRDDMNNPYNENTPGGKAIKFYCSLRMRFRLGSPVDFLGNTLPQNTENPAGYIIQVRLLKQKTAPFDRKNATYFLMCQTGIRPDYDYAGLAVSRYGIIKKAAAWFTMLDPYTGEVMEEADPIDPEKKKIVKVNGMARVYEYLETHPEYYQRLQKFIVDDINGVSGEGETDVAADEVL
jgi:recombination protein RecA